MSLVNGSVVRRRLYLQCDRFVDRWCVMRRVSEPEPGGYLLNGVWYATEAPYWRALAARDERCRRPLALIGRDDGGDLDDA